MVHKLLFWLLLPLLLSGPLAAHGQKAFYIPKALLLPLHTQRQQLHTSLGVVGGVDLNLSYAFADHFALFATGTVNKGTRRRTTLFGDRYNMVKDDLAQSYGLGYFRKAKGLFDGWELYTGYGRSKVDNYWYYTGEEELGSDVTRAHYHTWFGQVDAGGREGQLQWSVGSRLSYTLYDDLHFYDTHPNTSYIVSRYENLKGLTFEPAFSLGYKFKAVVFTVQAGWAIPLHKASVTQTDTHFFTDTTIVVVSKATKVLSAGMARLGIQYNVNVHGKK